MPLNFVVKLAITAAMYAAQTAITASKRIYGPRLDSTKVSTAEYGTPWARGWGRFRIEGAPVIAAADLVEHVQTRKGKGGKQVSYKYTGTWMSGFADVVCDAVTKILLDKHVVYQSTAVGPVSLADAMGFPGLLRIHLGAEDQLPDSWYQTWREARHGADSTPAMRGRTTVVFENVQLENFGNRIPNVGAELVRTSVAAHPYEQKTTGRSFTATFARGGTWMTLASNGTAASIEFWDLPTRTLIRTVTGVDADSGTVFNVSMGKDGTAFTTGLYSSGLDVFGALYEISPLGMVTKHVSAQTGFNRVFDLSDGTRKVLTAEFNGTDQYLDFGVFNTTTYGGNCVNFCDDDEDVIFGLFLTESSAAFVIGQIPLGETIAATGTASRGSSDLSGSICYVASEDHFVVIDDDANRLYGVDRATGTIKFSRTFTGSTLNVPYNDPTATSFFSDYNEISLVDGTTIRTITPLSWVNEDSNGARFYDSINNSIWTHPQFEPHLTIRALDRVGTGDLILGDIVGEVCDWIGAAADVSQLTQPILGYQMTQGDAKAIIEPLLDLHDVDAVPHGFTTLFRVRGDTPTLTVQVGELARDGNAVRYTALNGPETDLPQRITLTFADPNADLQKNTASFARDESATDSKRVTTIDVSTLAMEADEAKGLIDRFGMRQWNERGVVSAAAFSLQQLGTEPGDVLWLWLDDVAWSLRLQKWTLQQGRIAVEFKRDDPSLHSPSGIAGAPMDGHNAEVMVIPVPSTGGVLDVPLLEDSENSVNPLLHFWAGPLTAGSFPGGTVYEYDSTSGDYAELGSVASDEGATWGLTEDALGDVPTPWMWDRGNAITVNLLSGTLVSATEDEINADAELNQAVIGAEIVQFSTATLQVDGSWLLSGFKRGRRGTEWACGGHAAGEQFILAASLKHEEIGLSAVGVTSDFKEQTFGRNPDLAPVQELAFAGRSLMPYAPARLAWTTDGTDLLGEITRRTRIGGAWIGGTAIPLSENSEAYEVDIYHGSTFKRTIAVSDTNLFTYTAAMMSADSNSVGSPPPSNVYQMSDAVGRGFALAA